MSTLTKPRVTGIGGVFFKANDAKAMNAWYRDMLGMDMTEWGAALKWGEGTDAPSGTTAFSINTQQAKHYSGPFMLNFRVHDLPGLIEHLRANQVRLEEDGKIAEYPYGKFAHCYDLEGNKIELWEAIDSGFDEA